MPAGLSFKKFGRILEEKAKADWNRVFQGTEKTRERLGVVDELLAYWNLDDSEDTLEELEDALIVGERGGKVAEEISSCITESGGRPRQRFSVLALYVDDEADPPVQRNFSEVRDAVAQLDVVEN